MDHVRNSEKHFRERGEGRRFFTFLLEDCATKTQLIVIVVSFLFFFFHFLPYHFLSSSFSFSVPHFSLYLHEFWSSMHVPFSLLCNLIISIIFILHVNFTNITLTLHSHELWNFNLSFRKTLLSFHATYN